MKHDVVLGSSKHEETYRPENGFTDRGGKPRRDPLHPSVETKKGTEKVRETRGKLDLSVPDIRGADHGSTDGVGETTGSFVNHCDFCIKNTFDKVHEKTVLEKSHVVMGN